MDSNKLDINISTSSLLNYIPHRPPMVWIDQVHEFSATGGTASLRLASGGLYLTERELRPSACIEMIAQSYAFCIAAYRAQEKINHLEDQKAFLATIKDFKVHDWPKIAMDEVVVTKVAQGRQFGPITIIKGQVFWLDRLIASAELKIFSGS